MLKTIFKFIGLWIGLFLAASCVGTFIIWMYSGGPIADKLLGIGFVSGVLSTVVVLQFLKENLKSRLSVRF